MPLHNRKYLETYRKELRKNMTISEARMWKVLQKKRLKGRKFRRQHSVGNYILDFFCPSEKLAVEIDGSYHSTPSGEMKDDKRDKFLKEHGIRVLRFTNDQVRYKIDVIVDVILDAFENKSSTTPGPS